MPNPIFFVDGKTEQLIVQRLCEDTPVQITGLNGKSVTIPAIAKKLSALIKLRGGRNYPIVVLIDREQRTDEFNEIADALRHALNAEGHENDDIRIGVADRMIENWAAADLEAISGKPDRGAVTDGQHGAGLLKRIRGEYSKTTDGVELFAAARPGIVYQNSPSYRHFVDQLYDVRCHYLDLLRGGGHY